MSIPFGTRYVTLIHRQLTKDGSGRTQTAFKTYRLNGCSWRKSTIRSNTDTDQTDRESIVCRIPQINGIQPHTGDILVLGDKMLTPKTVREFEAILDDFRGMSFKVSQVSDNTGPGYPLPHYAARGE